MYNEVDSQEAGWIDQQRFSRRFLLYIATLIILGLAAYTYSFFFTAQSSDFLKIFIFVDVFAIVLLIIYWYLQIQPIHISTSVIRDVREFNEIQYKISAIEEIESALALYSDKSEPSPHLLKYIDNRMHIFPYRHDFREFESTILTDATRLQLFKNSLATLKEKLNSKKLEQEERTKSKSVEDSTKDKSIERMIKLTDMATSRLKKEIAELSKRANIYITFGSAITLLAGVFLYFTVQDLLGTYSSKQRAVSFTSSDIISLGIRFSIVIFIEVFAFYYLRLYRNIMDNIKFYQNEITNIEMKILSLHAVENSDCNESLKVLSAELSKTERNFVIDKNKTTIDLERSKQESNLLKSSSDNIVKIIKSIKA